MVPELPPWATVESADSVTLRGLGQPIDVVRLGLPRPGPDTHPDPICRIPLTQFTAVARRNDDDGRELLFCAESCAEMWEQRRSPTSFEVGSIREGWMR